eukprot:9153192-Alexandrium_andersonii.AAC.1
MAAQTLETAHILDTTNTGHNRLLAASYSQHAANRAAKCLDAANSLDTAKKGHAVFGLRFASGTLRTGLRTAWTVNSLDTANTGHSEQPDTANTGD